MTRYDASIGQAVIDSFDAKPEMLLQILHGFMDRFGHIPEAAVRQIAQGLNLSRADVYGVVSYYHDFRTEPPGRHVIRLCQAEACQALGARALTEHATARLGIGLHESSSDYTLEPAYCLGNCACAPAVMIDGQTYGRVSPERFDRLVDAETGT